MPRVASKPRVGAVTRRTASSSSSAAPVRSQSRRGGGGDDAHSHRNNTSADSLPTDKEESFQFPISRPPMVPRGRTRSGTAATSATTSTSNPNANKQKNKAKRSGNANKKKSTKGRASSGIQGMRLSFSSAINDDEDDGVMNNDESNSFDDSGSEAGETGTTAGGNTTTLSTDSAVRGPLAGGGGSSGRRDDRRYASYNGGPLLGEGSMSPRGRPSLSASLMRAMTSGGTPTPSQPSPTTLTGLVKRPRHSDPFLEEEEEEEAERRLLQEQQQQQRAFTRTMDRGFTDAQWAAADNNDNNDSNKDGVDKENHNEESPLRVAKKPRLDASPHATPRMTRGSLGLSSLSINQTPSAQVIFRNGKLFFADGNGDGDKNVAGSVSHENEEGPESPFTDLPTTIRKQSQRSVSRSNDAHDGSVARDFTPDQTVQAILSQEPHTATRAAELRPGFAPPSPRTPLWMALEAHRNERANHTNPNVSGVAEISGVSGGDVSGNHSIQQQQQQQSILDETGRAGEVEEEDIFAYDWSPLSAPRRPRGSHGQVLSQPERLPSSQTQSSSSALFPTAAVAATAEDSRTLFGEDAAEGTMAVGGSAPARNQSNEEEGDKDNDEFPSTLVSSRGFRHRASQGVASAADPQQPMNTIVMSGAASGRPASASRARSGAGLTAGVSMRPTNSAARRRRLASVSVERQHHDHRHHQGGSQPLVSARHRSINLLESEGRHDDEMEPLFADSASYSASGQPTDASFELMMQTLEGRSGATTAANHAEDTEAKDNRDVGFRLTQEAAELDGIEQGHGLHLSRRTDRFTRSNQQHPPSEDEGHGAEMERPRRGRRVASARSRRQQAEHEADGETSSSAASALDIASASTYEWVRAADFDSANSIFPNMQTATAAPPAASTSLPSSQSQQPPMSARTQQMLAWAEQARSFFRFIDQRPLVTVSPKSSKNSARRRPHTSNHASTPDGPRGASASLSSARDAVAGTARMVANSRSRSGRRMTPKPENSSNSLLVASVASALVNSPRTPSAGPQQQQQHWNSNRQQRTGQAPSVHRERVGRSVTRGEVVPTSARGGASATSTPRTVSVRADALVPPPPPLVPDTVSAPSHVGSSSSSSGPTSAFAAMIARAKQKAASKTGPPASSRPA